jgi:putative ABC transport system permease protein
MLLNDLKLAIRHLWRKKLYSTIILSSLAIGFTCTTLLISFLISEIKTDSFHKNKDRLFQLFSNDPFGGGGNIAFIPGTVGDYIGDHYPEVENICRLANVDKISLETAAGEFGDVLLLTCDSSFFSVFSFPLKQGSIKHVFGPESIILTEDKANVLFGTPDVVGKMLSIKTPDTVRMVTVSGVVASSAEKSHLKFDALIHHSALQRKSKDGIAYVLLKRASQAGALVAKINGDPERPGLIGRGKMTYALEPLQKSYFNKDNKMPYVKTRNWLFIQVGAIVCGLIFFIAGFNFINLFLLSLQERQKEMGVKKTLGLSLRNLIRSSFSEVIVYVTAGFACAAVLTGLLLPSFNTILDASLNAASLLRIDVFFIVGFTMFLLGFSAVVISAWQQWKVRPVSLMKNAVARKVTFSRPFFLLQFVISVTLIICAVTIIRQMYFIENAPLGFNRNLIQVQSPSKELSSKLHALKEDVLKMPGIDHVTVCSGNPISGNAILRFELENGEFYTPYTFSGDDDFIKTLDLTLLEGKPLSAGTTDKLVNETFVRYFNLRDPVGQKIPGTEAKIIGVVKDFTCMSFKEKVPPVMIGYSENSQRMLIGYSGHDIAPLLSQIQNAWKNVFPDQLFSYQVIQQDLLNKYKEERFFYSVIVLTSIISMAISCFGLFALSWAVVQGRVKEIGIRKVLGASTQDILKLLTSGFITRILVAFLISAPIGYRLMDQWLDNFANKITLDGWTFLYSGGLVILISLATLSLQTFKASMLNPVDELRTE